MCTFLFWVPRFAHLSYQEYLAAKTLARMLARDVGDLAPWLHACAGEPWWSDVLLMVAELLAPADELLSVLAQDASGHLVVGGCAKLSYGANILKGGQNREVQVRRIADEVATVRVQGSCRSMTVPRAVVQLPATGVGVLLLAAARAGATPVVAGLIRGGVHIGVVDGDQNTALHLACEYEHEACACALVALGAIEHPLAKNMRMASPMMLAAHKKLSVVTRRLGPTPGDIEEARGRVARLPLVAAAQRGALAEVERLLRTEELEAATPEGCTALSIAAEGGHAPREVML